MHLIASVVRRSWAAPHRVFALCLRNSAGGVAHGDQAIAPGIERFEYCRKLTRIARGEGPPESLRDVQQLAGHSSLATTQRYIEGDTEAKRKLVNLI